MNSLNYIDQSLILQQQLILQQMLIYYQIQKASFNQTMPSSNILNQKLEEIDFSNIQLPKHDDTNPIQPHEQKLKTKSQKKSQKKEMKQPKTQNTCNKQQEEFPKTKKVFLSMLNIKEAQYKKFKAQRNEENQKSTALIDAQK
ncbi:unnamed protein product [Paramecium primaurelia]|uniref:Uncharacterized protein n=1 Tax=Paramecium primaurelia TaxID=5886 RepID=A0A8S1KZ40_PARPR|nr:unnamed protein product [Paramecium primaurelia]